MSLSSILRRLTEADETVADPQANDGFDFSHVPQGKSEEPAPVAEEPIEEIPPTDEPEATEEVVEEPETKTTRLLSIDKRKVNEELKELCSVPASAIPLSKIKEILANYKLKISDAEVKFVGRASNKDLAIVNDKGIAIGNSQLIIYWNRDSETSFTVNAYLS